MAGTPAVAARRTPFAGLPAVPPGGGASGGRAA
jgi:hypothetical protein